MWQHRLPSILGTDVIKLFLRLGCPLVRWSSGMDMHLINHRGLYDEHYMGIVWIHNLLNISIYMYVFNCNHELRIDHVHMLLTSNLPRSTFKGRLRVSNEWSHRGSYVHKPMIKFSVPSPWNDFFFVTNFSTLLMVSVKTIHKAFRIHKTLNKTH